MKPSDQLAFPRSGHPLGDNDCIEPQCGMSLRDWFASQALINVSREWTKQKWGDFNATLIANICYEMADTMLKEREKWETKI